MRHRWQHPKCCLWLEARRKLSPVQNFVPLILRLWTLSIPLETDDYLSPPSHSLPSPIVSLSSLSHSIPSHYIRLMSSMFGSHTFLSSSLTFSFSLLRGLTFSLPPHSFSLPPSRFNIFSSHPLRLLSGYFMSHVNEHFDKALFKKKCSFYTLG